CEVGGQGAFGQLGNVQAHCLGNRTFGAVPTCDDLLGSAQSTIQQCPCLGQFHVIEVREVVVVGTFPTLLDELVDLGGDPGVTEHTTAVVIENKDQGVLRTCLGNVGSAGEHADDVVDVTEKITVDMDGHGRDRTQPAGPLGSLHIAFTQCEHALLGECALGLGGAQSSDRCQSAEPGRLAGGG